MELKIIDSKPVEGFPNYAEYLVEVAPIKQMVFFEKIHEYNSMKPVQLVLPWMLYKIKGPAKEATGTILGLMVQGGFGRDKQLEAGEEDLYFMPWPNLWAPQDVAMYAGYSRRDSLPKAFHFSNCVSQYAVERNVNIPLEQSLELLIHYFYDSPFRYLHIFDKPYDATYKWLGLSSRYKPLPSGRVVDNDTSLPILYKRWEEEVTLENVTDFPWGKIQLPLKVSEILG